MDRNFDLETKKFYQQQNFLEPESSEGGLNLSEIKDAILRKLPLIAACSIGLTSIAFFKISTAPPIYFAGFELLSEPLNIETEVTSTDDKSSETREEISTVELDEVQLKILKSPKLILRVVEALEDKYPELNYQELTQNLTIDIVSDDKSDEDVLQVVYSHPNKYKVSDIIGTLTRVYQEYSVEKRQSGIKRGISFLDRQIPRIKSQITDTKKQLEKLRAEYDFVNPDITVEQITTRSNNIEQERSENAIKLQQLRLTAQDLERELQTQAVSSTTAAQIATPRYTELLNQLRALDLEIGRKSVVFSDNSIQLQALKNEKRQIVSLIDLEGETLRQKLDNQIKSLENRQQNIANETVELKAALEKWSEISSEYKSLEQQLARANNKLNEFNLRKDALAIDAAQQEAPWQLLTPASEPKANNISTVNYLLLSSILGLMIGIGIAIILDKQQQIIYTTAKVEKVTDLPVLITIPHSPNSKNLSLLEQINFKRQLPHHSAQLQRRSQTLPELASPSVETFRSFAANLGIFDSNTYLNDFDRNSALKSVVITSAIPREGKSTVAFNLAKASASMGKKVLLVDTDLRSTDRLSKNLGLETQPGLKNILCQENLELGLSLITKLPIEENFFILTSGFNELVTDLPNLDPSRLLASAKMHLLMEELKKHFDLIIYDLCAIIGFADVNLLAAKTDGIVIVTGLGKIQSMALTEALNQLKLCKAPILGVAVNGVVSRA